MKIIARKKAKEKEVSDPKSEIKDGTRKQSNSSRDTDQVQSSDWKDVQRTRKSALL